MKSVLKEWLNLQSCLQWTNQTKVNEMAQQNKCFNRVCPNSTKNAKEWSRKLREDIITLHKQGT